MKDLHRARLELPQSGRLSEAAIRAAYWRLLSQAKAQADLDALREAKRALLYEAGVRIPKR